MLHSELQQSVRTSAQLEMVDENITESCQLIGLEIELLDSEDE